MAVVVVEEATVLLVPSPTRTTSYPLTAVSSVAATQPSVTELSVTAVTLGAPGAVGASVSSGAPSP